MFIVFEGIDGSGKTTQAKMLYDYLKATHGRCILTKEITDGPIGLLLKRMLESRKYYLSADYVQLLCSADRAYHLGNLIIPELKKGNSVISDRYLMSTIVYGVAGGLDRRWLKSINSNFKTPDLTFLIDIDPKTAMIRIDERKRMRLKYFENLKFLKRARKEYLSLSRKTKNCFVLDGSKNKEEINKEIIKIIERKV